MMLLFVPFDKQESVRERLSNVVHIPFQFESEGSQIIFVDNRSQYEEEERVPRGTRAPFVELQDL